MSNNDTLIERRRQGAGGGGSSTPPRRRQQGAVSGDEVPVVVSTDTSEGSTESQGVIGAREDATQGSPASEWDDQRGGGGQMRPEHGEGHGPRRKGSSWRTPGQLAEAEAPARSRQVELTLDISSELHVKPGYDAPSFKEVQRIVLLDVLEKGGRGHHARQPASTCSTTSTQQVELGPPVRAIVTVPNVRHGGE